jgi:E3 ubiquitin-protein ligase DOA10
LPPSPEILFFPVRSMTNVAPREQWMPVFSSFADIFIPLCPLFIATVFLPLVFFSYSFPPVLSSIWHLSTFYTPVHPWYFFFFTNWKGGTVLLEKYPPPPPDGQRKGQKSNMRKNGEKSLSKENIQ